MKADVLGQNLAILDVDLVADEDDRNVLAYTNEVAMPRWDVLVGHARCYIKEDDCSLCTNVVAVAKTTKFFLKKIERMMGEEHVMIAILFAI